MIFSKRLAFIWIFAAMIIALFFGVFDIALAQEAGLDVVGEATGLGNQDIKLTIANIIRIVLGFLGIIAVIIVIYGGFVWMTAGGNDEKVAKAKNILIRGVIGLAIILLSWAITSFVISALLGATGAGDGTGGDSDGGGSLGGSSTSSFIVSTFTPTGEVPIRNVQVQINFSRSVDESTVDGSVSVTAPDGAKVDGVLETSGNKVTFVPSAPCPSPNEDRFCFDSFTEYTVNVSEAVFSTTGTKLDCEASSCSGSFTTGDLVDVDDPNATVLVPDSGDLVPMDLTQDVRVAATDDSYVGTADFSIDGLQFDSVAASGPDLSDVIIETVWDTAGLILDEYYTVEVTVTDIAGNTDEDTARVKAVPAYCFNGMLDDAEDPPEEGIDCGGLCGACDGAACTDDSECSGDCIDGFCVSVPEITDVTPLDGSPGTFVTITGTNFRTSEGIIEFIKDGGGTVEAEMPACSAGWSSTQVIVEVPAEAGDGPITLTTSQDLSTSTDEEGIEDFDVNEIVRPNLCRLSPDHGPSGTTVSVTGNTFGLTQGPSIIEFGSDEVDTYNSWSDEIISILTPVLSDGEYPVSVIVNGTSSNEIAFDIAAATSTPPFITYVSPDNGGEGQYVTITGTDFGSQIGSVWFESTVTGVAELGSTDFPDQCADDFWNNDEIVIIVPDVTPEQHQIYIETQAGAVSNREDFTVSTSDPTPGVCAIEPDSGVFGDVVTVYGDGFGSSAGVDGDVTFYNEVSYGVGPTTPWGADEITVEVPAAAETGSTFVTVDGGAQSNRVNFEVSGEGEGAPVDPGPVEYAWIFSTGEIPIAPELRIECNAADVSINPSGVPNEAFTNEVCRNAIIFGEFTTLMNTTSIETGGSRIEKCNNDSCTDTDIVAGIWEFTHSVDGTSVRWAPIDNGGRWESGARYRVTITSNATSDTGIPMEDDAIWYFDVSDSLEDCDVDRVSVTPLNETLTAIDQTTEFGALPLFGDCQVLNSDDYTWEWDMDYSYVSSEEVCSYVSGDTCVTVTALAEGQTDVEATVDSGISGAGNLTINFTDPYVDNQWPDCSVACINAEVGASFNTGMDLSIESVGNVLLYECETEFCVNLEQKADSAACTVFDDLGDCIEIAVNYAANLDILKYYRVVISGDVMSASGVPLTRLNYGDDYSWTFLTRDDPTECAVDRIEISPDDATLHQIGETQIFTAIPYGAPDSCSVAGQRINGYDYDWNWTDPIVDDPDFDVSVDMAYWNLIDSSLHDSNPEAIADGCTSSCLSTGSEAFFAVCGNSVVETGEDCDDGNGASGDGCSESCLNEGSNECSQVCSDTGLACSSDVDCSDTASCDIVGSLCCGNGAVDVDGAIVEECDDGNINNGDGCSASCLNEGAAAASTPDVVITCGDSFVSHLPIPIGDSPAGGEECDDGGKASGDGCSAVCLNEGSVTLTVDLAICGNGVRDLPYETCDDGNSTNGDGCSDRCLREGALGSHGECGDGVIDRFPPASGGEDCDGGEGCSEQCTFLGSSLDYLEPSVCGDGERGYGEVYWCEFGYTGDGDIDPVQLAVIDDDAALEVNPDTGLAIASIEVETEGITANAELSLSCTAQSDDDCSAGYGVDDHSCCSARPDPDLFPNSSDACLNSAIYALFNKQMDLGSFEGNAYVQFDDTAVCPDSHEEYVEVASRGSIFARIWRGIKRFFGFQVRAQLVGDCLLPLTGFTQTQIEDEYRVSFAYNTILEATSDYTIVIKGGEDGVRAADGVIMEDDAYQAFTTSTELCALEFVEVRDTDEVSPQLFTTFEEMHEFIATPISLAGGIQREIEPITDVYDWSWEWIVEHDEIVEADVVGLPSEAEVTSQLIDGETNVLAQASIIEDGESTGEVVPGILDVVVLLCENPWPSHADFPFIDDTSGSVSGTTEGSGWMNFSTYYCLDIEGSDDLLPEVAVIAPPDSGADEVLKEYLFTTSNPGDVVGFRISENPDYLSPMEWYLSQGFEGSPTPTIIDGHEAVEDGRTIYIAASNETSGPASIYSNIYVISYNDGAEEDSINIYNQLLENLNFVTNLDDTNLCHDGTQYLSAICSSDFDCDYGAGEFCASEKDKLRRDTKRLADLKTVAIQLDEYGMSNGLCSATTSQSCVSALDCPAGESCLAGYPTLPGGTFVRSISSSAWSSWDETLGDSIGTAPVDPLNQYKDCGADYDPNTCVNEQSGEYMCPEDSYTYHYRSLGAFGYQISADLEYSSGSNASWQSDIDPDTTDQKEIKVGNAFINFMRTGEGFWTDQAFCTGAIYGTSEICGDGIVGASEVCEIGDSGLGDACDADGDGIDDGSIATVCNVECSGFEPDPSGVCVAYSCGNGLIEDVEICDDGTNNGKYGFCAADCGGPGFSCGDGSLAGGEVCDCGTLVVSGLTYGGGSCTVLNGVYESNPANSCSWDCSAQGPYCGDEVVDSGEECDGDNETYADQLCGGADNKGMPCLSNDDCPGGGNCGYALSGKAWTDFCPRTTVCLAGADAGEPCTTDGDCFGSSCSTFDVQTTRMRTCLDDGASGEICEWSDATWQNIDCLGLGSCGDGVLDDGEECDDGNDNANDSCTTACTNNICGDGYLYDGTEQCDEGGENGVPCSASYGSSCNYCSTSCLQLSNSGAFCGDGIINGEEFCDASDLPYYWYKQSSRTTNGECDAADEGEISGLYTCSDTGVCDGGSNDGLPCLGPSGCSGGSCVKPVCGASCESSCPYVYDAEVLQLLDNQVGAVRSTSADLLSSEAVEELTVLGDPTAATVYLPACSVADSLTVDIDDSDREIPSIDIMLVLDKSISMDDDLDGSTPLIELESSVYDAIGTLFSAYGETSADLNIGWAYIGDTHVSTISSGSGYSDDGDMDGDGIPNGDDNCPEDYNPTQSDSDDDGIGDACDDHDDTDVEVHDCGGGCLVLDPADCAVECPDDDGEGGGDAGDGPDLGGGPAETLGAYDPNIPGDRFTFDSLLGGVRDIFRKIRDFNPLPFAFATHDSGGSGAFLVYGLTNDEGFISGSVSSGLASVASTVGTPIYESIDDAAVELRTGSADFKYMIIFTDGNIYNNDYDDLTFEHIGGEGAQIDTDGDGVDDTDVDQGGGGESFDTEDVFAMAFLETDDGVELSEEDYMRGVTKQTQDLKAEGIKIFTAVLTTNRCDISQMARWSSMDCANDFGSCNGRRAEGNYDCEVPEDGITYAYSASTAEGLAEMYEQIVDSMLNVTVTVEFDGSEEPTTISPGTGREISIPTNFTCDGTSEQEIFISTSFTSREPDQTIEVSNFNLNMCTP